jgi:membrane protein implicated in regulation of membrane protease activity
VNTPSLATLLITLGIILIAAGLLYASGLLSWFGRLPGDIRIVKETTRIYIPIVSMLIVSVVLSLVMWVIGRIKG